MEKNTPKLNEIGRKHGMRVPDNYFADFAEKMTEQLPEREFPLEEPPTMWLRVRPWVYMAAMFAGIWLMMRMFTGLTSVVPDASSETQAVASVVGEGVIVDDDLIDFYVDDYAVYDMLYADTEY